ncbi:Asp-tRNA(Asn)/Glu-tRNA(Gln) amidotransferase subunit GatC [Massilicoli timonensis]|uniref:Asp-tRNA(Asn)/Glu-tRNA(Gln) amidotransferase subunit GatC n=1 Tax=Massilicoli timonensis TaxID=2015901 RepID=A0ABT1SMM1_9FIRM|nr:Asp-tRNA(Asn)/Glu-tRNA(Gln) amidotransferase subunit GatC [Massilicoli timonensis]MCQ5122464.1 Asp-tRNA(Asn)/Glu-tRNA(Gln) amidotransferase subunit GatC [Massilicoli timonensis]HIR15015.1 Asp-tRNA(Asn)/Glu-tRNA(Gln) amidotransferase subunit GatC [Candidatus Onthosoma merdavium]
MEQFDDAYFRKLANQIMFDLSEEEIRELKEEFTTLLEQLDLLNRIDTEGVEEMIYPFETPTHYLRKDVSDHVISKEEALRNVASVKEGHVAVPKVVK